MMEDIMRALQNIQCELTQQKQDMKDMVENLKQSINENIDQKFTLIETKSKQLEQKIETQQKTIDFLDMKLRKRNVIFFGVPDNEKNYEDLLQSILEIINSKMEIACPKWEIESVARLGKNKGRVRPVIVTTTTFSRKLQLLKNKKSLVNTGIYIKEDFTPAILQKRKELQEEFNQRRLSGEKVILRFDKIVTLQPKGQHIQTSNTSNKRSLSESPEAVNIRKTSNDEGQVKQVPKKNKSQNITSFLRPSNLNSASKASTSKGTQDLSKN